MSGAETIIDGGGETIIIVGVAGGIATIRVAGDWNSDTAPLIVAESFDEYARRATINLRRLTEDVTTFAPSAYIGPTGKNKAQWRQERKWYARK